MLQSLALLNPKFYRRYANDTITKRKKNAISDEFFSNMNSHHKNIELTVESKPTRFLDTAFNVNPDGSVTKKVFRKPGKFPAFWNSQIPKSYKRNNVNGNLHRSFKITPDFDTEVSVITKKYRDAGYPIGFIKSVISDFKKDLNQQLHLTGCLKNVEKFYLNYLIALEMSMTLKDLSRKLKLY